MTEQHRPEQDQDDTEGRGVPTTVTSDGERVVVVTPDGMGVASHDDPPADENRRARPTRPTWSSSRPRSCGSARWSSSCSTRCAAHRSTRRAAPAWPRSTIARSPSSRTGWPPSWSRSSSGSPCPSRTTRPSDAELRIAQAQLVGWLEGLFHGIQTALVAQQMAAQAQLQQMRQLPPGTGHQGMPSPGGPGMPQSQRPIGEPGHAEGTGQYL